MTDPCEEYLDALPTTPRLIGDAVRREIQAIAPYAEFGIALGTPTWSHGVRVVSLLPFKTRCTLHFWEGDALASPLLGRLRGSKLSPVRYLELRSILDLDDEVRRLLRTAFEHRLRLIADEECGASDKAALPV
jgi:hypothetical protein